MPVSGLPMLPMSRPLVPMLPTLMLPMSTLSLVPM
eukprot:CAMPEP_0170604410 /NCGR_PEP_ID=MMETSP0224-20130122/19407_1 /TAXON_ID=285029 /ORGANISM="Togula jolla, Strain CCCM 725" /LENGTH=34 /DNA_ID= /DNA_START= /DNA_END= /DNA_ORIENTATION=